MRLRLLRMRLRRRFRKGQQQVEGLGQQAEQNIERHFFRRFAHLKPVRRFVISWILLLVLLSAGVLAQNLALSGYFQKLEAVPGGIYNEGVLGTFTTANPLYATSDADTTVSHLLFAGLFSYNDQNQLVGNLASGYSVDSKGTTYTVKLKPGLTWQDGQPLTSADVLFTYQLIQNPDAQSPLQTSWQGITVAAPDPQTITFKLTNPLSSFPYNLINGIVPEHLLASVPPTDLRSADFNTVHPVGAGPFAWQAIDVTGTNPAKAQEQIALVPFSGYQGGNPKLQEFVVHVYADQTQMTDALKTGQLDGAEGLNEVPATLKSVAGIQTHNLLLTAETMVFFNTEQGVLTDTNVRQALVKGANVPEIISQLGYPTRAVREPLLMGQLGYDPSEQQAGFNQSNARAILTADGWVVGQDGLRSKAGKPLSFTLTVADTPEYHVVSQELQKQWQAIGVNLRIQFLSGADFQGTLSEHDYDAVLDGISIGVDPDVFVYWDSSQADVRAANQLNLSNYKSDTADAALEAGRTRQNPALRVIKYKPFLEAFQQDNPALGLYQPRLLYLTRGTVAGLTDHTLNTPTDRFDNVQNWEIRQAKVTD